MITLTTTVYIEPRPMLTPSADAASAMADAAPVREREARESASPKLLPIVRPLPPVSFLPTKLVRTVCSNTR